MMGGMLLSASLPMQLPMPKRICTKIAQQWTIHFAGVSTQTQKESEMTTIFRRFVRIG